MKKILPLLLIFSLLGCASTKHSWVVERANKVINGMTPSEVSKIMHGDPEIRSNDGKEIGWYAHAYYVENDIETRDAVFYLGKDGKTVGIPLGGIFGAESKEQFYKYQRELRDAEFEKAEKQRQAANDAKEKAEAESYENWQAWLSEKEVLSAEAKIVCRDKMSCSKAFALTQVYINANASQKIQLATDTIIETYNPTEFANVAMKAVKIPQRGTIEIISLSVTCGNDPTFRSTYCPSRVREIYKGFKPFLNDAVSK
jgi:hypothetical protein